MLPFVYCAFRITVARVAVLTFGLVTALNAEPETSPITCNKVHPYPALATEWNALPSESRTAILKWSESSATEGPQATLTAEQQQIVANLATAFQRAAKAPPDDNWLSTVNLFEPVKLAALRPTETDQILTGSRQISEDYDQLKLLAQITVKSAATAPLPDAINSCAAVWRMSTTLRGTPFGIMAVRMQEISNAATAARLGEFSAADLERYDSLRSEGYEGYPTDPVHLCTSFFKMINYLTIDRIIGPGLAALLYPKAGAEIGTTPALGEEVVTTLRLTGVITGSQPCIGLERTQDGAGFWVPEGQTVQGVKLLSIDQSRKTAYILIGKQNAIVRLSSKQALFCRSGDDIKRLQDWLSCFKDGDSAGTTEDDINRIIRYVRTYPNGLKGYLDHLRLESDRQLKQGVENSYSVNVTTAAANLSWPDNTLLKFGLVDVVSLNARCIAGLNVSQTMLEDGLWLRERVLKGLPLVPPRDHWADKGKRMKLERAADGGFTLESVYQNNEGKPQTMSFGAPAGQP